MHKHASRARFVIAVNGLGVLLLLVTLVAGLSACDTGTSTTSSAPDGPYLHEVIKPAAGRKHASYAILLCRVADVSEIPFSSSFVRKLFLKDGQGTGNIYDYFLNMSYGAVDLDGTTIFPIATGGPPSSEWYTMTSTKAQLDARYNGAAFARDQTEKDCVAAATKQDHFDRSKWAGIVAIINIPTDSGNEQGNGVVIGVPSDRSNPPSPTFIPSFIEHEMGHALGLVHSMSMNADSSPVHTWSPGGDTEYGDCWDIMSALGCTFGYQAEPYGRSGPEMEAALRDYLGWMPTDRIYTYAGPKKATVTLAAVNEPRVNGSLLVKIPVGSLGNYTVEFRHKSNWDQGIPHDAILIHELRLSTLAGETSSTRTFLVWRANSSAWLPGQVFQDTANKVRISVDSFNGQSATVTISTDVSSVPGAGTGGDNNCDSFAAVDPILNPGVGVVTGCEPKVTLTTPTTSAARFDGKPIAFAADVTNPVGDALPNSNIVWTANGAPLGTGRSFSATLPKAGSYTIRVTATNSVGLQGGDARDLILCDDASCTPQVHITAPADKAHVYAGVPFTLAGTLYNPEKESVADAQVTWTAGSTKLGLGRTLTTSIGTPGVYTVTLHATNPLGYDGSASITLIVDPAPSTPTVSITAPVDGTLYTDVPAPPGGQSVTLQAVGSSGVTQFDWSDSSQGVLGSGATLTVMLYHDTAHPGNCGVTTHVITLTGTRSDGKMATAHITVTLRATCIR